MAMDFSNMTHDEIVAISLKKNSKNVATREALEAQKYLWEQAGEPFQGKDYREQKWNNNSFEDDGFRMSDTYSDTYSKIHR